MESNNQIYCTSNIIDLEFSNCFQMQTALKLQYTQSFLLEYWRCHYYLQKEKLHQIKIKLTKKKKSFKIISLLSYFFIEAIALCAPCFT